MRKNVNTLCTDSKIYNFKLGAKPVALDRRNRITPEGLRNLLTRKNTSATAHELPYGAGTSPAPPFSSRDGLMHQGHKLEVSLSQVL